MNVTAAEKCEVPGAGPTGQYSDKANSNLTSGPSVILEESRTTGCEQRTYWAKDLRYKCIQLLISVLGFGAIAVGLYLNHRQAEHVTEALRGNLYSKIATYTSDLDRVFIERPHLREYFYDGKEISPDHPDFQKVVAIAEYKLDIFEHNMLAYRDMDRLLPRSEQSSLWREGHFEWIKFSFEKSPILCKYLELRKSWYTHDLYDAMKAATKKTPS